MASYVKCTVCGETVGRLGIGTHAGMHRREFTEAFGREPEDYDEVREALGGVEIEAPDDQATLRDYVDGGCA